MPAMIYTCLSVAVMAKLIAMIVKQEVKALQNLQRVPVNNDYCRIKNSWYPCSSPELISKLSTVDSGGPNLNQDCIAKIE